MTKGLERATMKSRCNTTFISALLLSLCLMSFIPGGLKCAGAQSSTESRGLAQPTQSTDANKPEEPLGIEVKHIGRAEAASVVNTGFFPSRQPVIYWHDQDWNIDLVIPPTGSENDAYSLRISSSSGAASTVLLPEVYAQIKSITRAPRDKVILDADCGGTCSGFLIVDLKEAKVIDDIGAEDVTISPDGRFILYNNGYPSHGGEHENLYHLYDTMKPPSENVCGYSRYDSKHERLVEVWRGFQVFPQKPGQIFCTNKENDGLDDDNMAMNFTWAADSSKIVFADVKSGVMSLVVVTMPVGTKDLPRTSVYPLTGAEDVCAGVTDSAGEKYCNYGIIQSLGWEVNAVKAVFDYQSRTKVGGQMTIPVSKFVAIGK